MTLAPKSLPVNTVVSEAELDEDLLSTIRAILTEEGRPVPRRILGQARRVQNEGNIAREATLQTKPVRRKMDSLPVLEDPVEENIFKAEAAKKPERWFARDRKAVEGKAQYLGKVINSAKPVHRASLEPGARLVARIRAYRPTAAHLLLALIIVLMLLRSWLVIGLLFLSVFILAGIFFVAGYDRVWQGVFRAHLWYAKRRPARATVLYARIDRFAVRWDAVLDLFPEGTVDGLYLPDFATAEARHDKALERRLRGLQEKRA